MWRFGILSVLALLAGTLMATAKTPEERGRVTPLAAMIRSA